MENFEEKFGQFTMRLLQALPMDDAIFIASLGVAKLLPGNLKATIQAKPTSVDKADYFLDRVIKPTLQYDSDNLLRFIKVMQESKDCTLNKLAGDMKDKLNLKE